MNVVRLGRVRRIRRDEILLDAGAIATDPQTLFVDCTADGLEKRPIVPVFSDSRITLQALRSCQQVFSAALIAHIEAAYEEEDRKNDLATPVPHPDTDVDFLRVTIANAQNQIKWDSDPALREWLSQCRLDMWGKLMPVPLGQSPQDDALRASRRAAAEAMCRKLDELLGSES